MKKVGNKRITDFPAAKLYLDDLIELISVLEENCEEVQIQTVSYDEVQPSEIKELAVLIDESRFGYIHIKTHRPSISLDIRSFGIDAYLSEDNMVQHGIIYKVREIFEKRKRKYFGTLLNIIEAIPLVGFGVSIVKSEWVLAGMSLGLMFLMIFPLVKFKMAYQVVVLTTEKSNERSFFFRRKDDIYIAVCSALIGAIVAFVLTKYLGKV